MMAEVLPVPGGPCTQLDIVLLLLLSPLLLLLTKVPVVTPISLDLSSCLILLLACDNQQKFHSLAFIAITAVLFFRTLCSTRSFVSHKGTCCGKARMIVSTEAASKIALSLLRDRKSLLLRHRFKHDIKCIDVIMLHHMRCKFQDHMYIPNIFTYL